MKMGVEEKMAGGVETTLDRVEKLAFAHRQSSNERMKIAITKVRKRVKEFGVYWFEVADMKPDVLMEFLRTSGEFARRLQEVAVRDKEEIKEAEGGFSCDKCENHSSYSDELEYHRMTKHGLVRQMSPAVKKELFDHDPVVPVPLMVKASKNTSSSAPKLGTSKADLKEKEVELQAKRDKILEEKKALPKNPAVIGGRRETEKTNDEAVEVDEGLWLIRGIGSTNQQSTNQQTNDQQTKAGVGNLHEGVVGNQEEEPSFKCTFCGTTSMGREEMRIHIGNVHLEKELMIAVVQLFPNEIVNCKACGQECGSGYERREHLMVNHPWSGLEVKVLSSEKGAGEKCHLCSFQSPGREERTRKQRMKSHISREHSDQVIKQQPERKEKNLLKIACSLLQTKTKTKPVETLKCVPKNDHTRKEVNSNAEREAGLRAEREVEQKVEGKNSKRPREEEDAGDVMKEREAEDNVVQAKLGDKEELDVSGQQEEATEQLQVAEEEEEEEAMEEGNAGDNVAKTVSGETQGAGMSSKSKKRRKVPHEEPVFQQVLQQQVLKVKFGENNPQFKERLQSMIRLRGSKWTCLHCPKDGLSLGYQNPKRSRTMEHAEVHLTNVHHLCHLCDAVFKTTRAIHRHQSKHGKAIEGA